MKSLKLKKYLPRSCFGRALLIIILPIITNITKVSMREITNMTNVTITLATYPPTGGDAVEATCQIENVPLQAWTNLIMVLNGQALDCYLDGKLVRTCLMPGVPKVAAAGDLILTPNGNSFQGYTGNFQYFNRAVNPREAYAIYREGFGGSNWLSNLFNKYRIKLAFMKDNQEVNSFEI